MGGSALVAPRSEMRNIDSTERKRLTPFGDRKISRNVISINSASSIHQTVGGRRPHGRLLLADELRYPPGGLARRWQRFPGGGVQLDQLWPRSPNRSALPSRIFVITADFSKRRDDDRRTSFGSCWPRKGKDAKRRRSAFVRQSLIHCALGPPQTARATVEGGEGGVRLSRRTPALTGTCHRCGPLG